MKHLIITIYTVAVCLLLNTLPALSQIEFVWHSVDTTFQWAHSPYAADLDGDGDLDLIGTGYGEPVTIWENLGGYPPELADPVALPGDFYGSSVVQAHDLDGDGDLDIVGVADLLQHPSIPFWWENIGINGLGFTLHELDYLDTIRFYNVFDLGDLDGDGDLDLVFPDRNHLDLSLLIHENLGGGEFAVIDTISVDDLYGIDDMKIGDLNGDGLPDIVIAGGGGLPLGGGFVWMENLGGLEFADPVPMDIADNGQMWAKCIDLADMDGDGDLDVLGSPGGGGGAGGNRDKITWFENNGLQPPTFTAHLIEQWGGHVQAVMAVDLNNDSHMDVVAVQGDELSGQWGEIDYWLNDGEMNFAHYVIVDGFYGPNNPNCISHADFDGDGDQDVLGCAAHFVEIAWFENMFIVPELAPFHLLSPGYDAQVDTPEVLLAWEPTVANVEDGGETSYKVYISENDPAGYEMVAEVTDTTYLFTGDWNTYYFWKIKAESNLGFERWAEEDSWRFLITGPELEPFHLLSPADEAQMDSPEVQLAWRSTSDYLGSEISYEVYVAAEQPNDYNLVGESDDTTYTFTGEPGIDYFWRVKAVSNIGAERWAEELDWSFSILGNSVPSNTLPEEVPSEFAISSIYPNPFNSSTTVTVALPVSSDLTVTVYDLSGRLVRVLASGPFAPGVHTFTFDASGLPSGMYFVQGNALGTRGALRKILLLK